jgi:hypothetical protein
MFDADGMYLYLITFFNRFKWYRRCRGGSWARFQGKWAKAGADGWLTFYFPEKPINNTAGCPLQYKGLEEFELYK